MLGSILPTPWLACSGQTLSAGRESRRGVDRPLRELDRRRRHAVEPLEVGHP